MTLKEIAEELGVSERTVKETQESAIRKLRAALESEFDGPIRAFLGDVKRKRGPSRDRVRAHRQRKKERAQL